MESKGTKASQKEIAHVLQSNSRVTSPNGGQVNYASELDKCQDRVCMCVSKLPRVELLESQLLHGEREKTKNSQVICASMT